MDTIKLNRLNKPQMIAHRGLSGLEPENTNAAFIAAGNRSYWGIETDIHLTKDGKFIVIHDDTTRQVALDDLCVESSTFEELRNLLLLQKDGKKGRTDLRLPSMEEYIGICKAYGKIAVLEIKNPMPREAVHNICQIISDLDYMDGTIFISFDFDNLLYIREKYPRQTVQFLCINCDDALIAKLADHKMDLDIEYLEVTKEVVEKCHNRGILVNVWTVDTLEDAQKMCDFGVDYITSNILE